MDINALLPDLFKKSASVLTDKKMGLLLPTELQQPNGPLQERRRVQDETRCNEEHSTGKRVYYCQRCLNHGLREKRKNHKQDCHFRLCQCDKCFMVDQRRQLNTRMHQIQEEESGLRSAICNRTKTKERIPNCQHCAQHNKQNRLKGHKRSCPYKNCPCGKCRVVRERQALMAAQIKLRRQQKKQKEGDHHIRHHGEQLPTFVEVEGHSLMASPSMMIVSQLPQPAPLLLPPPPHPPSLQPFAFPFADLQNGCHTSIHNVQHHHGNTPPSFNGLSTFFHYLPLPQQTFPYVTESVTGNFVDHDSLIHNAIRHNLLKSYLFGSIQHSPPTFI
uniref:DM domain-containing protein n=1 Tax=Plectus sambesii TaxID=2011161 RepID=A0A914WPH3_9BILA